MRSYTAIFGLLLILLAVSVTRGQPNPTKPVVGVCASDEQIVQAKKAGFDFIVPSVSSHLKPNLTDGQFLPVEINENSLPVFACNSFFPSRMKCVGPDSHRDTLLLHAETVFKRAKQVGVSTLVFGSGGARTIPDGFSRHQAEKQFVELCVELAQLAMKYEVRIALENLNKAETNLINTVAEAIAVCKQVNMPNFGVNVDIYHMLRENEPPENILKARDYIFICDIAEPKNRTPPGVEGTDFSDYFRALLQINYQGGIAVEARWDDFAEQAPLAYQTLNQQLDGVYK